MIFKEINPNEMERFNPKDFPDYYLSGEYTPPDRLFFYNGCYVELNMIDEIPFLAILNTGDPNNLFKCEELQEYILDKYKVCGYVYKIGIKNEIFIKRMLKKYKILNSEKSDMYNIIIFKRS